MTEEQKTEVIEISDLYSRCAALKFDGWRLVQIGCTGLQEGQELNYTFDKDLEFLNLRIFYKKGLEVPSIQSAYSCAFVYENEIAELFGVTITGMAVDFNGKFYKLSVPTPFCENDTDAEVKS
jgi:ech hydrogenase subunit D